MKIKKEKKDDILIEKICVKRATANEADSFRENLMNDIKEGNFKIIIDLSECEFIDSTFLSSLIMALKEVSKKEGDLKIVSKHIDINSVLELTKTSRVIGIFESTEEAIASFKNE